jgi:transposase
MIFAAIIAGHVTNRDQNAALNILGRGIVLPVTKAA